MYSGRTFLCFLSLCVPLLTACSDDGGGEEAEGGEDLGEVPETYEFESRFEPGVSSVAYSGQTFRQVLIMAMKTELSAIQDEIAAGSVFADGDVAARLYFYYQFDSASSGSLPHGLSTTPAPLQTSWDDISTNKDLVGKIAGNDEAGQHKDWTTDMVGWPAAASPDDLVVQWIEAVDDLAVEYSIGNIPVDPLGNQVEKFFISPEGLDYQQLLQKFLLGAVNFSQAADDYLDDDTEGKGLLTDNTAPDGDAPYTALEHQWDEAFGYFGAAVDYLEYSDDEIATAGGRPEFANGYHDSDGDGAIDLLREINFGVSVNAGKRDRGAATSAPTDFSTETMTAFLTGRHIIARADGALSDEQFAALQDQRDIAVLGWEKAMAASAIHYFNKVIQDLNAADYSFSDHAKHWGELKGFLLSLQFSRFSPVSDADDATIHDLVGTAPVLPNDAELDVHIADLLAARDLLAAAYGFDAANIGDENGENGW